MYNIYIYIRIILDNKLRFDSNVVNIYKKMPLHNTLSTKAEEHWY